MIVSEGLVVSEALVSSTSGEQGSNFVLNVFFYHFKIDNDVLLDVCELYLMDVLFMRDLGYTTSCDDFV